MAEMMEHRFGCSTAAAPVIGWDVVKEVRRNERDKEERGCEKVKW